MLAPEWVCGIGVLYRSAYSIVRQMALKKAAGYILVALSCLAWAAIFALPLFDISLGEVAALTTGLIVAGEATFFLGIVLLGREAWERITAVFRKRKS
jgi:hypothetical protein